MLPQQILLGTQVILPVFVKPGHRDRGVNQDPLAAQESAGSKDHKVQEANQDRPAARGNAENRGHKALRDHKVHRVPPDRWDREATKVPADLPDRRGIPKTVYSPLFQARNFPCQKASAFRLKWIYRIPQNQYFPAIIPLSC